MGEKIEWRGRERERKSDQKQRSVLKKFLNLIPTPTPSYSSQTIVHQGHGLLHRMNWWRIILDEAHTIKSLQTTQTKATNNLEAEFKWCLTGTPIQNSIADVFPLIQFLRIRPYNDWGNFKHKILDPYNANDDRAVARLRVVLKCKYKREVGLFGSAPRRIEGGGVITYIGFFALPLFLLLSYASSPNKIILSRRKKTH